MKNPSLAIAALAVLGFSLSSCTSIEFASGVARPSPLSKAASSKRFIGAPKKAEVAKKSLPKKSVAKTTPPPAPKTLHRQKVRTTAYCHLEGEAGAPYMKTAINTRLRYGTIRSAASDWSRFPLGTQFRIVGRSGIYEIEDFGSALAGTSTIDLYMPTMSMMNNWGVRHVDIEIIKWGSYARSAKILSGRTKYRHCRQMYYAILTKL